MLKSILFTHDDLDGAGCRIIYELAHIGMEKGVEYDVINCSNTNIDAIVTNAIGMPFLIGYDTEICFADIICSRDLLSWMSDKYPDIKIWDHHATNFPAQQVIPSAVIVPFNNEGLAEESGTSLIYKHYCEIAFSKSGDAQYCSPAFSSSERDGRILSKLVDAIRAYDTYEWKRTNNMEAKKMQTLFFLLGMEYFCNRYIDRIRQDILPSEDLFDKHDLEFINVKLTNEQRVIESITKESVIDCDVRGYKAAFLMYPVGANISEVGYQFLEKYPEYDLFVAFTLSRGGEFSFRSQKVELDMGKMFAEPIGGGGHPRAAGAPVQDYVKDGLLKSLLANINGYYRKPEEA